MDREFLVCEYVGESGRVIPGAIVSPPIRDIEMALEMVRSLLEQGKRVYVSGIGPNYCRI